MRIIGLTGGIACGKSNVSSCLQRLGAAIIDGDLLSRELTKDNGAALPLLRQTFGDGIFTPEGQLDRRALGRIVFEQPEARGKLDGIMQPMIYRLILQRISEAEAAGYDICVLDMPLLYEKKLETLCSCVWCVWIPREEQLRRLIERDGFSREEAEARLNSQMPADEKMRRADVVIDTSGTIAETSEKIPALFQREMELCSVKEKANE